MFDYSIFICSSLIVLAAIRFPVANTFVKFLQQSLKIADTSSDFTDLSWPKVRVILCLRGADPDLSQCVEGLLQQNYPSYEVQIVIDSYQDPAWEIVTQTLSHYSVDSVQVRPLQEKYSTCSLKCSSVLQAVSDLDSETNIEAIAILDADVIPHANWLRDLIQPLLNPNVGATTGYRWYIPEGRQWGAWVRYIWNCWSLALMLYARPPFPWGGSSAVRTKVLHQTNILKYWRHSLSEDTSLDKAILDHEIIVEAVPQLMLTNREDCDLKSFFNWVKRQLLMPKLYSSSWRSIVFGAIINSTLLCLAIGALLVASYTRQWQAALWLGIGFLGYVGILLLLLIWMEEMVRQVVQQRGESMPNWSVMGILQRTLTILPTQLIIWTAILFTTRMNQVTWRGITYCVEDDENIHFDYIPFRACVSSKKQNISVL
jgi:cellulose synthase/poly-beta-1,6-N-acetylglucosamine synthase-like glycosyltransferase